MRHHAAGLSVSLALHAALLSLIWLAGPIRTVAERAIPVTLAMFQVERIAEPAPVPEVPVPEAPRESPPPSPPTPTAAPRPRPRTVKTERPSAPVPPAPVVPTVAAREPEPVAVAAPPPPPVPKANIALLEARYLDGVRNAIEAKKFYPRRASRLGQEGTVRIALIVLRDGTIRSARVVESSGHPDLDEAALRTVTLAGHLSAFPPDLERSEWEISVPMKYYLN